VTDSIEELDRDWLCRRIVEGSGDAVLFADREGTIRFWNAGASAVIRDVTDRFTRDRGMRKRLAELEAKARAGDPEP
jgi:hypothetical protein